jgi:hypothetical protein
MLKIPLAVLNAVAQGRKPDYEVVVYFQEPEVYTEDDYLQSVGDIASSMSNEGGYQIANTIVTLKNVEKYFSHVRLPKELPDNKLVEIYAKLAGEKVLIFRGIVQSGGWKLTPMNLILNINA